MKALGDEIAAGKPPLTGAEGALPRPGLRGRLAARLRRLAAPPRVGAVEKTDAARRSRAASSVGSRGEARDAMDAGLTGGFTLLFGPPGPRRR